MDVRCRVDTANTTFAMTEVIVPGSDELVHIAVPIGELAAAGVSASKGTLFVGDFNPRTTDLRDLAPESRLGDEEAVRVRAD